MKIKDSNKKLFTKNHNIDSKELNLIKKIYDDNRAGLDALKYL